ncbi:hypothetical protein [Acrocarpospora sp. B8E8]|uniref:hypothetical protein n=1 Tax=Acrocarpospora sp. B8E8 TaxID=3153572 RepID=UPI00325D1057
MYIRSVGISRLFAILAAATVAMATAIAAAPPAAAARTLTTISFQHSDPELRIRSS